MAFNDSHDGDYVLLGIVRGEDAGIGVDLMQLSDNPLEVQEGISEQVLPPISHLPPATADETSFYHPSNRL